MPVVLAAKATSFSVAVAPLSSLQESLSAGRQRNLVFHLGLGFAEERKQNKHRERPEIKADVTDGNLFTYVIIVYITSYRNVS